MTPPEDLPNELPAVASRAPVALDLPPGDYLWCACGRSARQPFCDGSHQGSRFEPVKFTVDRNAGLLWLCTCKRSADAPLCDGSHNRLNK